MRWRIFLTSSTSLLIAVLSCGGGPESYTTPYGSSGGGGGNSLLPPESEVTQSEREAEYHKWNLGGGLQPVPSGIPAGYKHKSYSNPVFGARFMTPDPTVLRVGKYFYVTSTAGNLRLLRSTDLINWEYIGDAFTVDGRPAWNDKSDGTKGALWAPDLNVINGKYVLYYSVSGDLFGIGRAVSDNVEGPYTDLGKLIFRDNYDTQGNIDQFYFEYEGVKYLGWGSFKNIFVTELTDDGLNLKYPNDATKIKQIAGTAFEGGMLHKRGDWFYFFGSVGGCCNGYNSTYHVQVARSKSPFGPFLNKNGVDITSGSKKGLTILEGIPEKFIGPGHNAEIITDDAGDDWLLYHCFQYGVSDSKRLLFLDKITWDSEGWPVINDGHPSSSAQAPVFLN